MERKICCQILRLGLVFITVILFTNAGVAGDNPFEASMHKTYIGRYTSDTIELTLSVTSGQLGGTLLNKMVLYKVKAIRAGSVINGNFEKDGKSFPFAAELNGDIMKFSPGDAGPFKLKRYPLTSLEGKWKSDNVKLVTQRKGDNKFEGLIFFNNGNFSFKGKLENGNLIGKFSNDSSHHEFMLFGDKDGIVFKTGNFVEKLQKDFRANYTAHKAGKVWTENTTHMEFIWVPGGCYMMGSDLGGSDEKPVHKVCINGFWIGKYEVTQGQYEMIMGKNPSYFKKGGKYPVEQVSWHDAQSFISALNSKTDKTFRLPSEAEWEYAARGGGEDQVYSGGASIDNFAWFEDNSGAMPHEVGTKSPNSLGVYDMSGNLWEWCQDWYYKNYYANSSTNNPSGPSSGTLRVFRGGSWFEKAGICRSAFRYRNHPSRIIMSVGFRLVLLPGQ